MIGPLHIWGLISLFHIPSNNHMSPCYDHKQFCLKKTLLFRQKIHLQYYQLSFMFVQKDYHSYKKKIGTHDKKKKSIILCSFPTKHIPVGKWNGTNVEISLLVSKRYYPWLNTIIINRFSLWGTDIKTITFLVKRFTIFFLAIFAMWNYKIPFTHILYQKAHLKSK